MVANLTVKRYQGFETGSSPIPTHSELCQPPGGLPPEPDLLDDFLHT